MTYESKCSDFDSFIALILLNLRLISSFLIPSSLTAGMRIHWMERMERMEWMLWWWKTSSLFWCVSVIAQVSAPQSKIKMMHAFLDMEFVLQVIFCSKPEEM